MLDEPTVFVQARPARANLFKYTRTHVCSAATGTLYSNLFSRLLSPSSSAGLGHALRASKSHLLETRWQKALCPFQAAFWHACEQYCVLWQAPQTSSGFSEAHPQLSHV